MSRYSVDIKEKAQQDLAKLKKDEPITPTFIIATAIMAVGCWIAAK